MDHLKDPILSSVCALAPVCGGQQLELASSSSFNSFNFQSSKYQWLVMVCASYLLICGHNIHDVLQLLQYDTLILCLHEARRSMSLRCSKAASQGMEKADLS